MTLYVYTVYKLLTYIYLDSSISDATSIHNVTVQLVAIDSHNAPNTPGHTLHARPSTACPKLRENNHVLEVANMCSMLYVLDLPCIRI